MLLILIYFIRFLCSTKYTNCLIVHCHFSYNCKYSVICNSFLKWFYVVLQPTLVVVKSIIDFRPQTRWKFHLSPPSLRSIRIYRFPHIYTTFCNSHTFNSANNDELFYKYFSMREKLNLACRFDFETFTKLQTNKNNTQNHRASRWATRLNK